MKDGEMVPPEKSDCPPLLLLKSKIIYIIEKRYGLCMLRRVLHMQSHTGRVFPRHALNLMIAKHYYPHFPSTVKYGDYATSDRWLFERRKMEQYIC